MARNLVSIISLAAFLVDVDWHIVFYYDAAAEIVGSRFEETGSLTREQWNAEVGPVDELEVPVPFDRLPLTIALRDGRPAYGRHCIRAKHGPIVMEAGTMPLVGPDGHRSRLTAPACATYPITSQASVRTWRDPSSGGSPATGLLGAPHC